MIYSRNPNNPFLADARSPGVSLASRCAAQSAEREEIEVGGTYTFYSSWEGFAPKPGEPGQQRANYTGQQVKVVGRMLDWDAETSWGKAEGLERGLLVEAADGHRFDVYEGELNGWYRDTSQFVAPVKWFEQQKAQFAQT